MLIRLATKEDIASMAAAAVAAYVDDPQDAYLYPRRHTRPDLFLKVKSNIIKNTFEDSTAIPIVAVMDETDQDWKGVSEVMGYCLWFREQPESETTEQDTSQDQGSIIKRLKDYILDSDIVDYVRSMADPITSAPHARAMAQTCSDPNSQEFKPGYVKPRSYYGVYEIGVDPKFGRRGVARQLMNWGIQKADEEKVPVYLSATPAGKPFYLNLGFQTVGWWIWRPKQDEKWDIMQRDPLSVQSAILNSDAE